MPCQKCGKKIAKLATPDVKDPGKRAIAVNKLIEKRSRKDIINSQVVKCLSCKMPLHVKGKYCPRCAHKQGLCHLCGKKIFDTSSHCMSIV